MKIYSMRLLRSGLTLGILCMLFLTTAIYGQELVVGISIHNDTSLPLREMVATTSSETFWEKGVIPYRETSPQLEKEYENDYSLQLFNGTENLGNIIQNFDGIPVGTPSIGVAPPDPSMDVGPNHVMQMVNVAYQIFDKNGNSLLGPFNLSNLWTGFPGPWSTSLNDGDPVVLYDQAADRWFASEFSLPNGGNGPEYILIAISATPDPTGAWHRYGFEFPEFPDYPHYGIWPDGYYMSVNRFAPSFTGTYTVAFERDVMINGGNPAQYVYFTNPPSAGDSFMPSDWDGTTPPPVGAPNYFAGAGNNNLLVYEFDVDWINTANSTFTGPLVLPVTPFSFINDIQQLGTTTVLDGVSPRLMQRLQYRNFGTHQSMVTCHSIDAGASRAGMRWYELRNTGGGWTLWQQGTYAPADGHERWMGSIAMNGAGDIALGYTASSATINPQIRFTGRRDGDPLGIMTITEQTIIAGGGSQTNGLRRWGDYSQMSVDPVDDNTFWYTHEYIPFNGSFNWRTRIASFNLGGGVGPPDISVAPPNMVFNVPLNGTDTDVLTISNVAPAGSQDLNWNINEQEAVLALSDGREIPVNLNISTREDKPLRTILADEETGINFDYPKTHGTEVVGLPFSDGFESGNFNLWIDDGGSGTKEVTNTTAAEGIYSFHYLYTGAVAHFHGIHQEFNPGSQPEYVSFYIRSGSTALADAYFVLTANGNNTEVIWFYANEAGFLYANGDVGGNQSFPYNALQWYHIEFKDIDWASKTFDYYIDGALIQTGISFRNAASVNDIDRLYLYNFHSSDAWWDEIHLGSIDCPWLSANPTNGTIPAGGNQNVNVTVDATGLAAGTYNCSLDINSNDPDEPTVNVPVELNVGAGGCSGIAIANAFCNNAAQNTSTTVGIEVNMSGINPPDQLLGSFTATLNYNPALLDYTNDSGVLSGFTGNVIVNEGAGLITFNGANPSGAGGAVPLLNIDFNVIGPVGNTFILDLEFSAMAAALSFTNLLPCLNVNDGGCTIIQPGFLGDVNNDELCNSTDALIILSFDVGLSIPPDFLARINAGYGDVNSDGLTNSTDALIILSFDAGISVPFPVCQPFSPPTAPTVNTEVERSIGGKIEVTANPVTAEITRGMTVDIPVNIDVSALDSKLGSYTATLEWDNTTLEFESYVGGTTRGFETPTVNVKGTDKGKIVFSSAVPEGAKGKVNVLNLKLKVIGKSGQRSALKLSFSSMAAAKTFDNLLPYLESKVDKNSFVSVGNNPTKYGLDNYPNPFNPTTRVSYSLPVAGAVKIVIYNTLGQQVRVLVNQEQEAGQYNVEWNSRNDQNQLLSSGVYILRMEAADFVKDKKLLLMK